MEYESGLKLFFWIGTAIMVGLAFMVLLLTLSYQKKVHKIKQKEAENLLKLSLESEKRERKRIASDLHDGVMGDLNAIRNYITVLGNEKTHDMSPGSRPILKEVKQALSKMLENMQGISYNLMPPLLEGSGFVPTIEDYFDRVRKWNRLVITFRCPKDLVIPSSIAYELYRVVQELIANMLKYGKVKHVDFSIENTHKSLTLTILDDGVPFDFYKELKDTTGMGLKNIISRLKYIEAGLEQVPVPGGNKILISLKNTL